MCQKKKKFCIIKGTMPTHKGVSGGGGGDGEDYFIKNYFAYFYPLDMEYS